VPAANPDYISSEVRAPGSAEDIKATLQYGMYAPAEALGKCAFFQGLTLKLNVRSDYFDRDNRDAGRSHHHSWRGTLGTGCALGVHGAGHYVTVTGRYDTDGHCGADFRRHGLWYCKYRHPENKLVHLNWQAQNVPQYMFILRGNDTYVSMLEVLGE